MTVAVFKKAMAVTRSFLIGTASFLWQAALSIDRVSAEDLSDLIAFYKERSKHAPNDVLRKLDELRSGQDGRRQNVSSVVRILLLADTPTPWVQLYFVRKSLNRLCLLLADQTQWQQAIVNEVRIEVAYTASMLEEKIHPAFKRKRIHEVFHLNHAEHLKLKTVEQIAGDNWLGGQEGRRRS